MTDAVLDGGAPAPADTSVALRDDVINADNPIDTRLPAKEPEKPVEQPKKAPSASEAVKQAIEKVRAEDQQKDDGKKPPEPVKPETAPETRQRGDDGKFAAKQPVEQPQEPQVNTAHREAPARFSSDAKAAWETAPEPVKAEVHRAIRELESGLTKYKADAEEYEQLREYRELAKQHGTTIKAGLDNYLGIEQMLAKNPIAGLEKIMQNLNIRTQDGRMLTLRDVAAHVLNQPHDQVASQQASVIQELRAEISGLKQQLGGVSQSIEQQQQAAVINEITAFSSKPEHSRFEELQSDIERFLKSPELVPMNLSPQERLSEAYRLADRLNPAAASLSPPQPLNPATPAPLNPAGKKSIGGAPSTGNQKPGKGRAMSASEAIRLAMERVG